MTKLSKCCEWVALSVLLSVLAGCEAAAPVDPGPERDASLWPVLQSPFAQDPAMEARIDRLLADMTLEQKVGQVIQPELRNITAEQIREYHIGSILNGGGSYPNENKHAPVEDWLALADAFYLASMDTSEGGVAIPLMWGTDAVHGHNNVVGATIFPHNIGLGATNNPELIRRINAATALEVAVTGIDWNFSPTLAVARDSRWGRTYEAYSEDPALVKVMGAEAVLGLQGAPGSDDFMGANRVIATAKHFVGDGGTRDGIDRADAAISEEKLRDVHSPGYFSSIEAGVLTVMASFNSWQGDLLHGHHYLLTEVLKERMGFDGLVVGDWNGHEFIDGCTQASCAQAFNAGVDIFMVPDQWQALYYNTLAQVRSGEISRERLDDAVRRILRVKMRAGLFEKGLPSQRPYAGRSELLGAPEHRAIARQAVRESLVLLKNDEQLLPLDKNIRVLVAGDGADNIGKQSGGWTLTWQGTGNTNEDFPGATSIYQGIADAVTSAGGTAQLSEDGSFHERPDVAIVVFGEDPYAEMQGDVGHLEYRSAEDLALIRGLREQGVPVVSVFLTGRALWVNPFLNASDAFVVAWLPGSEGAGVADVLFQSAGGAVGHDFTGRLPFSWPKTAVQSPLNIGQSGYEPLFPYGFGLAYSRHAELESLSESSGLRVTETVEELAIFRDRPLSPWELTIGDSGNRALVVTGSGGRLSDIVVQSVDRFVQEDSRRVRWSGAGQAYFGFVSNQRTDLSAYRGDGAALVFDVQVHRAPDQEVRLGMRCGHDCGVYRDVTDSFRALPLAEWQTLSMSLDCLADQDMDLSMVISPFVVVTDGNLDMALHNVRVAPVSSASIVCD